MSRKRDREAMINRHRDRESQTERKKQRRVFNCRLRTPKLLDLRASEIFHPRIVYWLLKSDRNSINYSYSFLKFLNIFNILSGKFNILRCFILAEYIFFYMFCFVLLFLVPSFILLKIFRKFYEINGRSQISHHS